MWKRPCTTAVDYRSATWICQLLFALVSVFCLLTEEGGILEASKILNKEFNRWTTTNLLLWIYRRSQIYSTYYPISMFLVSHVSNVVDITVHGPHDLPPSHNPNQTTHIKTPLFLSLIYKKRLHALLHVGLTLFISRLCVPTLTALRAFSHHQRFALRWAVITIWKYPSLIKSSTPAASEICRSMMLIQKQVSQWS